MDFDNGDRPDNPADRAMLSGHEHGLDRAALLKAAGEITARRA